MRFSGGETFRYFINEEKRTIVAILDVPENIVEKEMTNLFSKGATNHIFIDGYITSDRLNVSSTYVGVAHCHTEDKFDIEKGRHLAELRAIRTYLKDRKKISEKIYNTVKDAETRFKKSDEYFEYAIKHVQDAIDEFED